HRDRRIGARRALDEAAQTQAHELGAQTQWILPFGAAIPKAPALSAQIEIPVLSDELLAEVVVPPGFDEPEAGMLVDTSGGGEDAMRPEGDLAVARLAGETHALIDQPRADPEPARPPPARAPPPAPSRRPHRPALVVFFPNHPGPAIPPAAPGDPAAPPPVVVIADEGGDDLRGQRFQPVVPAVLLAVDDAVAAHDP